MKVKVNIQSPIHASLSREIATVCDMAFAKVYSLPRVYYNNNCNNIVDIAHCL